MKRLGDNTRRMLRAVAVWFTLAAVVYGLIQILLPNVAKHLAIQLPRGSTTAVVHPSEVRHFLCVLIQGGR